MFLSHRSVVEKFILLLSVVAFYVIIFELNLTHAGILTSMRRTHYKGHTDKKSNIDKLATYRVGKGISEVNQLGCIEFIATGTMVMNNTSGNAAVSKRLPETMERNPQIINRNNRWAIKIYGDGVEHKFPPFLEHIIQRIQTYFSIYKYTDISSLETLTVENASENNIGVEKNFTSILVKDKNNYNVSLFSNDEHSLKEPPTILELQSTTQENNDDYTEFKAINENGEDLMFVRDG